MIDQSNLIFVDTETTGLTPTVHRVWEAAVIVDDELEVVQFDIGDDAWALAEPEALDVNGARTRRGAGTVLPMADAASWVADRFAGRTVVGKNPQFDVAMLSSTFQLEGPAPWHYRVVDVDAMLLDRCLALGLDVDVPWRSQGLVDALGLGHLADGLDLHTAAGDVTWVKRVWDRLTAPRSVPAKRFDISGNDRFDWRARPKGGGDLTAWSGGQGYEDRDYCVRQAVSFARPGDLVDGRVVGLDDFTDPTM